MSKGERTRKVIVQSALKMARATGLEGLSLGSLAAGVNMSKSGLFAHFKSKEVLQLEVLQHAVACFIDDVILPALAQEAGEPQVKALFEHYLKWICGHDGICIFLALNQEYDDRPGPIRDLLTKSQHDWHAIIARTVQTALEKGDFGPGLDPGQFAYEFIGIAMAFQQTYKLLRDRQSERKARTAFQTLLGCSRRVVQ